MAARSPALTGAQKRYLRSLAHSLSPVVQIGKSGLGEAVLAQIDEALTRHELIKIKLGKEAPVEAAEVADLGEKRLGAALAQTIGHVLVLYRRNPEKSRIELPKAKAKTAPSKKAAAKTTGAPAKVRETGWLRETSSDDEDGDFSDEEE